MIGNNKKNRLVFLKINRAAGYSFVEVMVSVVIFSVIMLSVTQIFKMVIDGQRGAIAAQNVEESLKYFSEVTGKEVRMAQRNSNNYCSGIPATDIFTITSISTSSDSLSFQNHYGECVTYQLGFDANGQQRFKITRGTNYDWITPAKIKIDSLHFIVDGTALTQPTVTFNLKAHATDQGQFQSSMTIQTSLTSRYYK